MASQVPEQPQSPQGEPAVLVAEGGAEHRRPRFSIVTAVYNVAQYLPDFIASIEKQYFDLSEVEVIVVDDGSTDESPVVLKDWAQRRPELVTVLTQANGGQGAARNLGIEHATGEWITFPDPDDMLEPGYLSIVDNFLAANPETQMIGTYRIFLMERTGERSDTHPLARMFKGDRLYNLNESIETFHGSAPAAFFRNDVIRTNNIRFDGRIRPNFEDGHFCSRYLLSVEVPYLALLKSAEYIYRKRFDNSSATQTSVRSEGRYLDVPRYGYLDLLQHGAEHFGKPPAWLQNFIIYELSWYIRGDLAISGGSAARGPVAEKFIELLTEINSYLDPVLLNSYKTTRFDRLWRDVFLHGLGKEKDWHTPYVVTEARDNPKKLVRIAYRYLGEMPTEEFYSSGKAVEAVHSKIRTHEFFDHTLMYERILWIPLSGTLRVVLNGDAVSIQIEWEPFHNTVVKDWQVNEWFDVGERGIPPRRTWVPLRDRPLLPLAKMSPVRSAFRDAWVIMDRITDSDDNGERLFRYLRAERPDINAWFVLQKGTPDWKRMVREGYGSRMVAHGSTRWKLLMLNCANLISSHADQPIHNPAGVVRRNKPKRNTTFLQHGVIKDDLSRWLNPKAFDLLVTSTPQEQASIAGDFNAYAYTDREAQMLGLARFDRLLELGSKVPVERRKWILVCPTWRNWLNPGTQGFKAGDSFQASEYAQEWTAFLSDPRLKAMAAEHGLQIGFLPHPNMQPYLKEMELPGHVEALTYAGNDIQQFIADAALMVTDYSSMAFNAAYLDRPVVYFQFDIERIQAGDHLGRPGYFKYEQDGFGPVTITADATVDAVLSIVVEDHKMPNAEYQRRISATFTQRDGRCCERTVAAIEDLSPKVEPPDRLQELARTIRANPRVQRAVRSERGRALVPKLKQLARDSGLRDKLRG